MTLEIELSGARKVVTSAELFKYAYNGTIEPNTRLWLDGKETVCSNVKGIIFSPNRRQTPPAPSRASANPYSAPQPPTNQYPPTRNENQCNGPNDPRVVRTPFLDYFIGGGSTPYVICYVAGGRSVYSSCGGRVWMRGDIETQTNAHGGFFKSLGRLASGETFFMSVYVAKGSSEIAFACKMPGVIVAKQLAHGESLVCQRGAFLAASSGVTIDVFFQKRIGVGFFGGEGFIMQRITGPGVVFLELDGAAYEYNLAAGERVVCDTGAIAWMDATCSIDIEMVSGFKNMLLGGEGVFNTVVTGPGKATFQSMSLTQTAGVLAPIISRLLPKS